MQTIHFHPFSTRSLKPLKAELNTIEDLVPVAVVKGVDLLVLGSELTAEKIEESESL